MAIPMPETVRKEIIRTQQELQRLVSPTAIRWTKPEQFHLTLRFLGDVPVERVPALQEAVNTVCSGEPALPLRAQGVGFFPNARSPRVIWTGVNDGEERLAALQKKMEDAVQSFAEQPAAEKFAGHVTLGRVKFLNRPEIEKLAAHARAVKDRLFGAWLANEVEIIQSRLSSAGAEHSLLASIHLAAR
ncbi:MAG TPA: RNA 2',3'-cyclic phosphodiesterase [Verrucomicrobiae bacterium]|nr:RNA 2',3'-cyclic phosphodiesterase [Verrucomicrobiae bacterium]